MSLEERLDKVPPQRLDGAKKNQLRQLCRDADRLARRDKRTGQLYIEEQTLRHFLRHHSEGAVPEGFVDRLKSLPHGEIIRGGVEASDARVGWEEFVLDVTGETPTDSFEALGLRPDATLEDIRKTVEKRIGALPDPLFDPAISTDIIARGLRALAPHASVHDAQALGIPNTNDFWDCVINNVGFWAALAGIIAVGALIASLATGGTFAVALAAALEIFAKIWGVGIVFSLIGCFIEYILTPIFS